jgi:hypothetical protein
VSDLLFSVGKHVAHRQVLAGQNPDLRLL